MTLAGKTLFISGGSRGIGLAIALRAARDGANVALIAKTAEPHPRLEGTVYTAAAQIEAAGGRALPVVGDIRDEDQVAAAVAQAVERFGGIDVCVNNASAINLSGTEALEIKRYDLMQSINTRGTFVVSRACIPHLKRSANPHILTLSPPVSLEPRWLGPHVGYTIAKYGMTLCALGFAAEFADDGIASNALWPRTLIATAAVQNLLGGDQAMARARRPELYADAAYAVVTRPSRDCTGNAFLCEDVLAADGVTDFDQYAYQPGTEPKADLFVDHAGPDRREPLDLLGHGGGRFVDDDRIRWPDPAQHRVDLRRGERAARHLRKQARPRHRLRGGPCGALRDHIHEQVDRDLGVGQQGVAHPRGRGRLGTGGDLQQFGARRKEVAGNVGVVPEHLRADHDGQVMPGQPVADRLHRHPKRPAEQGVVLREGGPVKQRGAVDGGAQLLRQGDGRVPPAAAVHLRSEDQRGTTAGRDAVGEQPGRRLAAALRAVAGARWR